MRLSYRWLVRYVVDELFLMIWEMILSLDFDQEDSTTFSFGPSLLP